MLSIASESNFGHLFNVASVLSWYRIFCQARIVEHFYRTVHITGDEQLFVWRTVYCCRLKSQALVDLIKVWPSTCSVRMGLGDGVLVRFDEDDDDNDVDDDGNDEIQ